jgi:hypothetical protein
MTNRKMSPNLLCCICIHYWIPLLTKHAVIGAGRPESFSPVSPPGGDYIMALDARFQLDERFAEGEAGPSSASVSGSDAEAEPELSEAEDDELALDEDMDAEGFAGPSKVVKPLTPEALKAFNAAQEKTGVVYISRIPPGMRPTKVRHLMGQHGEIGRVYLQQEGTRCSVFPFKSRLTALSNRRKACVPPPQAHEHEEGTLYRGLGRIQGQEGRSGRCWPAQCTAYRRQEGYAMEGRRVDYEIPAQVQMGYAHGADRYDYLCSSRFFMFF